MRQSSGRGGCGEDEENKEEKEEKEEKEGGRFIQSNGSDYSVRDRAGGGGCFMIRIECSCVRDVCARIGGRATNFGDAPAATLQSQPRPANTGLLEPAWTG